MCGRFSQLYTWQELDVHLDLDGAPANLQPRYNAAPGQDIAIVRADGTGKRLATLRWGLIPSWAREPGIGNRLINARSETVRTKPSFRSAFQSRRCLVPVDGFYEWTGEKSARQPWRITMRGGGIFCLAGLWEHWCVPDGLTLTGTLADRRAGDVLETFTILTTRANEDIVHLHTRMPVILAPDTYGSWLAGHEVPLDPVPTGTMTFHPVSTLINKTTHDDPRCLEPIGTV